MVRRRVDNVVTAFRTLPYANEWTVILFPSLLLLTVIQGGRTAVSLAILVQATMFMLRMRPLRRDTALKQLAKLFLCYMVVLFLISYSFWAVIQVAVLLLFWAIAFPRIDAFFRLLHRHWFVYRPLTALTTLPIFYVFGTSLYDSIITMTAITVISGCSCRILLLQCCVPLRYATVLNGLMCIGTLACRALPVSALPFFAISASLFGSGAFDLVFGTVVFSMLSTDYPFNPLGENHIETATTLGFLFMVTVWDVIQLRGQRTRRGDVIVNSWDRKTLTFRMENLCRILTRRALVTGTSSEGLMARGIMGAVGACAVTLNDTHVGDVQQLECLRDVSSTTIFVPRRQQGGDYLALYRAAMRSVALSSPSTSQPSLLDTIIVILAVEDPLTLVDQGVQERRTERLLPGFSREPARVHGSTLTPASFNTKKLPRRLSECEGAAVIIEHGYRLVLLFSEVVPLAPIVDVCSATLAGCKELGETMCIRRSRKVPPTLSRLHSLLRRSVEGPPPSRERDCCTVCLTAWGSAVRAVVDTLCSETDVDLYHVVNAVAAAVRPCEVPVMSVDLRNMPRHMGVRGATVAEIMLELLSNALKAARREVNVQVRYVQPHEIERHSLAALTAIAMQIPRCSAAYHHFEVVSGDAEPPVVDVPVAGSMDARALALGLRAMHRSARVGPEFLSMTAAHPVDQPNTRWVEFQVTDDGSGIPNLNSLAALDDQRLGLLRVKQIVAGYGGTFRVISTPGNSRVSVRIPVMEVAEGERKVHALMVGTRFLLVLQFEWERACIERALRRRGAAVVSVSTADEARERAARIPFAFIITDESNVDALVVGGSRQFEALMCFAIVLSCHMEHSEAGNAVLRACCETGSYLPRPITGDALFAAACAIEAAAEGLVGVEKPATEKAPTVWAQESPPPPLRRGSQALAMYVTERRVSGQGIPSDPEISVSHLFDPSLVTVLIADDSSVNRKVLSIMCKNAGLEAKAVENGREAVAAYERWCYTAVEGVVSTKFIGFIDIVMPEMNGTEAARAIRAIESAAYPPRCRLVAVTGTVVDSDTRAQYEAFGFDEVLCKPFSNRSVVSEIDKLF